MRKLALLIVVAVILAACGGDGGGSSGQDASATPFVASPLPPTWTASPPGFVATEEPLAQTEEPRATTERESGSLAGGSPLPPTWTPGRRPTITPLYTATAVPPTLPPAATFTPLPDYCYELTPITGNVRMQIGQSVTVQWIPIGGITSYYLDVRHPGGGIVLEATVLATSYEIPADTFTVAGAWGWEVWALDEAGNRICFSISGEIIMSF